VHRQQDVKLKFLVIGTASIIQRKENESSLVDQMITIDMTQTLFVGTLATGDGVCGRLCWSRER
jgi:hypothetical protein